MRESIRMIDFAGTGERPCKITGSCFAGTCESRFVDTGWCFRLTFQGLPDDVLGDAADDLTLQVLAGVRVSVRAPGDSRRTSCWQVSMPASLARKRKARSLFLDPLVREAG